ncbi:MAG: cobalamin biosynthesis protein CbiX [Fimbriiglobus sp.]|jgi:sirohydrochlorin ferrochelatase|nr:cobalamin biosynthesis protein CbiX [Fimbriiglobus sp.]
MNALLLIAHGSRRPEANADLEHVADRFRERGTYEFVQCSYLELAEPGIHAGGVRCVEAGATQVVLLPYFLSPGVHVREDLTEARDKLTAEFPQVRFTLAAPMAGHPLLIDILAERAAAAI